MSMQPAIDYTNKDFASLRQALLELAQLRLPEWTDRSPADLGVLLVDLFAYMGDIVLYYQDRIASEAFLATAVERRSVIQLLRLIGYELQGPIASTAALTLVFNAPAAGAATTVTVPKGAQFATKDSTPQTFEYLGADLTIDLAGDRVSTRPDGTLVYQGLPVRHSRSIAAAVIGTGTGEPDQALALPQSPAILETVAVTIDEGAGQQPWNRRANLLYHAADDGQVTLSGPDSADYMIQVDDAGVSWIVFGDGVYGKRPAAGATIRAAYAVGGGTVGNVAAGAITDKKSQIAQLDSVTNPAPAVGGTDAETTDHAVRFGPLAFRSGERAVTLGDFVALAHEAGGVAKVRARTSGWNRVELYVAPEGTQFAPAPADLKQRLVAFFTDRRMVGTQVLIRDPTAVQIDVSVEIFVEHNHSPEDVVSRAQAAVAGVLAFANVDLGQPLYLSKVYEALDQVDGAFAATVTRFRRRDAVPLIAMAHRRIFGFEIDLTLPAEALRSLTGEIPPDGRITIADTELPVPGDVVVTSMDGSP
ncbi:MAG TPA: baseplate J/gp47 family protein [Solirubrobacteraceae bacterium]|nr:baseplate J/gp47 family protein [Solirubrobacteraceae bacterium]